MLIGCVADIVSMHIILVSMHMMLVWFVSMCRANMVGIGIAISI